MFRYSLAPLKDLNIEDLRVALLNFIKAQQNNDSFLIRVEDSSLGQNMEGSEQNSIDILKKFAIDTENLIYQSKNLSIYQRMAKKLLEEKRAYLCFCDKKESSSCDCINLTQDILQSNYKNKAKFTIWIKEPTETLELNDLARGILSYNPNDIGSFLILNHNASPSQVFADAIDDMSANITMVIEKESILTQSAMQAYIHKELDYSSPIEYLHLPAIRLSTDDEPILIKSLLQDGFLPDAIINYLLLPQDTAEEIFYLPNVIESSNLKNFTKEMKSFNIEHLRSINKSHLLKMDSKKLSMIFSFADSDIGDLLKLFLSKSGANTINDLERIFHNIFDKKKCSRKLKELSQIINKAPYFKDFEPFKNYVVQKSSFSETEVINSLTLLLTGTDDSPKLSEVYRYIKSYLLEVVQCQ